MKCEFTVMLQTINNYTRSLRRYFGANNKNNNNCEKNAARAEERSNKNSQTINDVFY